MASPNSLAVTWSAEPVGRIAAPLREQVITALRQAILDFHLKPGQRLVERELIEQLGVSRTTVREALRELTSEGLVTVVPQRGAMVSAPTLDAAADLYEVRAALESLTVRRFVERATPEQVSRLEATIDNLAEVTRSTTDIREILVAKDQFYKVLVEGAASTALQQLLEGIQARVQILRATSLSEAGRSIQVVRELRRVVEAIEKGDADEAGRFMEEHVRTAAKTALASLRDAE
jgi:DNA-binding GntR family transcriptional regulator